VCDKTIPGTKVGGEFWEVKIFFCFLFGGRAIGFLGGSTIETIKNPTIYLFIIIFFFFGVGGGGGVPAYDYLFIFKNVIELLNGSCDCKHIKEIPLN
jgi:hypothetical protein